MFKKIALTSLVLATALSTLTVGAKADMEHDHMMMKHRMMKHDMMKRQMMKKRMMHKRMMMHDKM